MHGPEGVPEGEVGEVMEAGSLVNLSVEAEVIPVGIVEDGGHLEDPEERRVEDFFLLFGAPLNPDQGQFVFPSPLRLSQNPVKVPVPGFGLQVGPGVFDAYYGVI